MPDPLRGVSSRATPQSEAADSRQVRNNASGFTFKVSADARMYRFLTLGTDGGTYYVSERQHTKDNAGLVVTWAQQQGRTLVNRAVEISQAGRAPRNNPALFAVAVAASLGDRDTRTYAFANLSKVARTGTHLFIFAEYMEQFRGWGRTARWAFSNWYLSRSPQDAAYQMLKYRQRGSTKINGRKIPGWRQLDILRSAHPFAKDGYAQTEFPVHNELFRWHTGRPADLSQLPIVEAFVKAQSATTVKEWVSIIEANPSLSWEMLPDAATTKPEVWEALVENGLPQTALMRQMSRMTRIGLLKPGSPITAKVAEQLADGTRLRKGRVHPISVLIALRTYAAGHGDQGKSTWNPVSQITDAFDAAFYAAFPAVEPAGKRTMLAIDVSGSMHGPKYGWPGIKGCPLTPHEVAGALAMVTARTEPKAFVTAFTSGTAGISHVDLSPRMRMDGVLRKISSIPAGGTDCSLPMTWALDQGLEIDTFQIYTDSETWAGSIHPHQALERYRRTTGIPARMAVVGMTATDFTIADPTDPGSLDVAGFDSAIPALLTDFSRGSI